LGVVEVSSHQGEIIIEGVVRSCPLDARIVAHQVSIVGTDGHVYEVEPTYLGAYLQRFDGRQVAARARVLLTRTDRSVVRLSSLHVTSGRRTSDTGCFPDTPVPAMPDKDPGEVDAEEIAT